jgi:hypothetical protein
VCLIEYCVSRNEREVQCVGYIIASAGVREKFSVWDNVLGQHE